MKILITGANGFLGSWVTRSLAKQGHTIRVLHRPASDLQMLEGIDFESAIGDVTDLDSVVAAAKDVDSVFHLAGVIGYSRAQRPLMEKVNVGGTIHVVQACLKNSVRRLVHLSSVAAIGASFDGQQVLNEESQYNLSALNLGYFETKRQSEEFVRRAVKEDNLDAVILNPATIYGPGDALKGSRSTQVKVARGEFPFYTSGGVNVISVNDAVIGIISAWQNGQRGERYILGGENLLIKDLFALIAEAAGVPTPKIYLPNSLLHAIGWVGDRLEKLGRKGPVNSENAWTSTLFHWFDARKARAALGLEPRPAKEAIYASVTWMRERGLLKS